MRLLFLGAGAVGGYFGGRLIESGADVTFLVRPGRAGSLERDGLRIRSPLGDCDVPAKTVTRETVGPDYDLVMLAPKAYDLPEALESVVAAVGPQAVVLPFLNGLAHMDVLDRRFGRERVLGGVAHIAAVLEGDGIVRQLSDLHVLTAGGRDPATRAVAVRFIDLCKKAKFDSVLSSDIVASLWEKWTLLATLAGITTLMEGSVGQIMETRDGEALIRQLHEECLAVSRASGIEVSERARGHAIALLTKRGSTFAASMLRDLSSGHRTEHEHVLGDMLERADGFGQPVPLLRAAYCHMQVRAAARG